MESAKDRIGADGVGFSAAMARTGVSEFENTWWWIRNTWAERHVRTPGIVMRDPRFQYEAQIRFGQCNKPVQALSADGADDSFA